MKQIKKLIAATILSILVFCSISFITVLLCISPAHYYQKDELYNFRIGFPFTYYRQFLMPGSAYPNFNWNVSLLLADCMLTWLIVTPLFFYYNSRRK